MQYAKGVCKYHYCKARKDADPGIGKRERDHKRKKYAEDPEYRRRMREVQFLGKYGLTLDDKASRIAKQDGVCGACGSVNPGGKNKGWKTDHDHTTGELRGELCNRCNLALGLVNDSVTHLTALTQYLKFWGTMDCACTSVDDVVH